MVKLHNIYEASLTRESGPSMTSPKLAGKLLGKYCWYSPILLVLCRFVMVELNFCHFDHLCSTLDPPIGSLLG